MKRFLSRLMASFSQSKNSRPVAPPRRASLGVEPLEGRMLLSATPNFYWKLTNVRVDPEGVERRFTQPGFEHHVTRDHADYQSTGDSVTIECRVDFRGAPEFIVPGQTLQLVSDNTMTETRSDGESWGPFLPNTEIRLGAVYPTCTGSFTDWQNDGSPGVFLSSSHTTETTLHSVTAPRRPALWLCLQEQAGIFGAADAYTEYDYHLVHGPTPVLARCVDATPTSVTLAWPGKADEGYNVWYQAKGQPWKLAASRWKDNTSSSGNTLGIGHLPPGREVRFRVDALYMAGTYPNLRLAGTAGVVGSAVTKLPPGPELHVERTSEDNVLLHWAGGANSDRIAVWEENAGRYTKVTEAAANQTELEMPNIVGRYQVRAMYDGREASSNLARPELYASYITKTHELLIDGSDEDDVISVQQANNLMTVRGVKIHLDGAVTRVVPSIDARRISLIGIDGWDGDDTINLNKGSQPIVIPSVLSGGTGDDTIHGGSGADLIHGDDGDDRLFGMDGPDSLHGDAGDDWLDEGILHPSEKEVVDGGEGNNWLAHKWATPPFLNDPQPIKEIHLGENARGAIGAVLAQQFRNVFSLTNTPRIRYVGEYEYDVDVYDAGGRRTSVRVRFDGTTLNSEGEPTPELDSNRSQEFWSVLFHRAILLITPGKGESTITLEEALHAVTGRASTSVSWSAYSSDDDVFDRMWRIRLFDDAFTETGHSTPFDVKLRADHAYVVKDVYRDADGKPGQVVLYNPQGVDGGQLTDENPDDGLITLSWADFRRSVTRVVFC